MPVLRGWIAGVGSRDTPVHVAEWIDRIVAALAQRGYGLRSGGATGADTMFEVAAVSAGMPREIFVARKARRPGEISFDMLLDDVKSAAYELAARHHPCWARVKERHRPLHARNGCQVLGRHLDDPSKALICWAPNPKIREGKLVDSEGGTGQAIRVAHHFNVPAYNLVIPEHREKLAQLLSIQLPV